jgi:hypothetical protein
MPVNTAGSAGEPALDADDDWPQQDTSACGLAERAVGHAARDAETE